MNFKDKESTLIYIMGGLWFVILVLGLLATFVKSLSGLWFPALFVMIILMVVMMIRGSLRKGMLEKSFLMLPIVAWAVIWCAGFILAHYYAVKYNNVMPVSTPLGLHPSFFWIFMLYWFVGTLVLLLGYYFKSDMWLTKKEWDDFVKAITVSPNSAAVKKSASKTAKKTTAKSKAKTKSKAKKK